MTKQVPRLFVFFLFVCFASSLFFFILPSANADEAKPAEEPTASAGQAEQEGDQPAEQNVATEEWDITADRIIRYEDPESIVAEGNIVLVKRRKVPPKPPGPEEGEEEVTDWYILLEEEPEEEVVITPESLETDLEPVYEIQTTIKADWMVYDVTLNTIKARGNVFVEVDDQSITAEQATVNLEQEIGTFKKSGRYRQRKGSSSRGRSNRKGRLQDLPSGRRLGNHL